MGKYDLLDGSKISDHYFKCKYCGRVGQIYPMHFCSAINGMRDIEDNLGRDTIPLTDEENKEYSIGKRVNLFQRIINWFK